MRRPGEGEPDRENRRGGGGKEEVLEACLDKWFVKLRTRTGAVVVVHVFVVVAFSQ